MAYDERSFLNGLAAGLAATNARPLGAWKRWLTTGTTRVGEWQWPEGWFDTFVSMMIFDTREPRTVEYEYGPVGGELKREFRRVQPSAQLQTFYHVIQIPQAVPMPQFRYNAYLHEPGISTRFDSYFVAFPHRSGGQDYAYPGSPEQIQSWMTRTYRDFD